MAKHFAHFFSSLAVAAIVLFSSGAAVSSDVITVGQAIDLSGHNASIGRDYVAGIKTYFDMLNSAGGINGKRIQYLVHDDRGEPDAAVKITNELVERYRIDVLFGGVGDATTKAVIESPAFKRSGHILYAPLAGADYADKSSMLLWRPRYTQEIRHIFAHFHRLGINEVGVVHDESAASAEAYRHVLAEIRARKMKLAGTSRIGNGGNNIAHEAQRMAASKPGFVLAITDTITTALFLKEYRRHDGQTFVAGSSLINLSTLRELAGAHAVAWTVFSQVVPNPSAGTSLLQVEHLTAMRKYRDEAVSSVTLEGFAAAKALAKAIAQSRRTGRGALQDLIAQRADVDLGGLSVVFDANNRLSNYLDIALFKKGGGLMF